MTYSIVARDPDCGELGVAVQSAYFAVGAVVPWARAGVGAVASQAIALPVYGPHCLASMRDGKNAVDALVELERLLRAQRPYTHLDRGTNGLFADTPEIAVAELDLGLALLPDDENIRFTRAGARLLCGDVEAARADVRALIERRPTWELIVRSFAAKGMFAIPGDLDIDSFLGE